MARQVRKSKPDLRHERASVRDHGGAVAGVDEAGRGPLAGPVVAAAVIFEERVVARGLPARFAMLNDSKLLREDVREQICDGLIADFDVGIGIAEPDRIDRDNILNATLWAMQEAVAALQCRPNAVLVDGNRAPVLPVPCRTIVKGDSACLSIAAASVVAKVTRDRMMRELAAQFPQFGFETHKGYGTQAHLAAIARHGVIDAHRRSFRPVKLALGLA